MERVRRCILLLAAGCLILLPLIKGHGPSRKDGHVALLPYTSTSFTVRVTGDVASRGIFAFAEGADLADVIKMTVPAEPSQLPWQTVPDTQIYHGNVVEVSLGPLQQIEINVKRMKAREKMLLGIPLHPDQMDFEDWRCLPGIGPVLAKRILDYRQNNGEFGSLQAVRRVQGIGEKKYEMLRNYF
jgi:competence protein ComEA